MSGPEQPWWVRPGGAPPPGTPAPRAASRPAPKPVPSSRPPRHAHRLLLLGAGVVAAVVLIGACLWAWNRVSTPGVRLDVRQAEAGVAEILTDPINGYGANRVTAVACNNGENPAVRDGAQFLCAVEINDTLRRVAVEFTGDDGTYAVDGPR